MKNFTKLFVYFCLLLMACPSNLFSQDPAALTPYLRKSTSFECGTLNKEVPVNIYYITRGTHSRPWNIGSPVLVYVMNHGYPRIGTEADTSILLDYIREHYIVITVDFKHDRQAVSPNFDKDLHGLFRAIYAQGVPSLFEGVNLMPRVFRCFFVPAGCRVATDLVYWEIDKHGAHGTLDFIMERYNRRIAGTVYGKEKVNSPADMSDRQGRPFQYKLAMDIIYPSMADEKVPIVVYASTQVTRHPNVSPSTYRPHMMGFTMRGYAYAIIDHCYDPLRRHFWFNPGNYSLNPWNGLASSTAAIRFIRANAEKFNIDDRYIGAMGHSKGEYTVARLSDPDHVNQEEQRRFEGYQEGSPEPQPYPEYSSRIVAGYQSPGNWPQFVSADDVPTIVSHGERDRLGRRYRATFNMMDSLNVNHVSMLMKGLGHEPPHGRDETFGFDRYQLVHDFFDRYLKAEEKLPPVVLMSIPADQKSEVSPTAEITVHFAPRMDMASITDGKGITLIRTGNGRAVKGTWNQSRQNTLFTFTPARPLKSGETYEILISESIRDQHGINLEEEKRTQFTVK